MTVSRPLISRLARLLPLALAAGLLTGCMTPTPYAPRTEGRATGYTDRELAHNRYRVTFTGNTVTPRETVETYLLLRAAEVARAAGYGHFIFDTRNTRANHSYQEVPVGPGPDPFFERRFRPWGGFGWGYGYDPMVDVVVRTNYDAYAEIVLLTPEQAAKEPRALNTQEIITRLAPEAMPKNPPA